MKKLNIDNLCVDGCMRLVNSTIGQCFFSYHNFSEKSSKKRAKEIYNIRQNFANSKLLKMWCDCTDNFEYKKLKKIIIEKNEKYYDEYMLKLAHKRAIDKMKNKI
jgi:predicted nucleic acid-binding protein